MNGEVKSTVKTLPRIIIPVVIILGAVAVLVYLKATKPHVPAKPAAEKVWGVATTPAKKTSVQPSLTLFGEIVGGQEADLRPLVGGKIVETGPDFRDGGIVQKGDLLVAIDPFNYQAAVEETTAQLDEAKASLAELEADLAGNRNLLVVDSRQLTIARDNRNRRKKLMGSGAGTRKAFEDAVSSLNEREQQHITRQQTIARLEAKVVQSKAQVTRLEVSASRARRDLEETRLTSPFTGILTDTDGAPGKMVSANDRLAHIIDASRLEARFHVSATDFARLLESGDFIGRRVSVLWKAGPKSFEFNAVLDRTEGKIDATSGGILMFAHLEGSSVTSPVRPGAFVEVTVPDQRYTDVIVVPQSALHEDRMVYVVKEGRLSARPIVIQARDGGNTLISGDFNDDEQIVTTRFPEIGENVKVRIGDKLDPVK